MNREYGQGAYGPEGKKTKSNNRTFGKIFKYYFDNALAKNTNFLLFIIIIAFILGFIMTILQYSLELTSEDTSFDDNWWNSVSTILKVGKGSDWTQRFIQFLYWSFSIMVSGFVIGFLTTKISSLTKNLNKGTSDVIKKNHILLIGWSNNMFAILKELNIANESVKNQVVVIFSDLPNEKMQDKLKSTMKKCKHLKIVTRHGDPTSPDDIAITNPNEARAIIILNNEDKNDPKVVTTTLALCSILENRETSIIVSLVNNRYAEAIKKIRNFNIIPVLAESVISNVTAQACRERGLGLVILDFLDFDGDELYYKNVPQLNGKTYREALLSFDNSSVIGIVNKDNTLNMAPSGDTVIQADDELIFVAEDDSTIRYSEAKELGAAGAETIDHTPQLTPNKMLFVGWSATGMDIFNAMSGFMPQGSVIDIFYINGFVNDEGLAEKFDAYSNIQVNVNCIPDQDFDVEAILESGAYDDVMILGYTDTLSAEEADTLTLLKALQVDSASERSGKKFRTITQLIDSAKADLAKSGGDRELIVSNNLTALLMAQLVENPHLINVFDDLFKSHGSSINIHDIDKYTAIGTETNYASIVDRGTNYGESVIGLMMNAKDQSDRAEGLNLNPSKKLKFTPSAGDRVIVVSHEETYL